MHGTHGIVEEHSALVTNFVSVDITGGTYAIGWNNKVCVWDEAKYCDTVATDSVMELTITGSASHPFHMHVYHVQIIGNCGNDYVDGEWYDTISTSKECKVRTHLVDFSGSVVVHCHSLVHEDDGQMMWLLLGQMPTTHGLNPPYKEKQCSRF